MSRGECSFTDEQITGILASLILSQSKRDSFLNPDPARRAVEEAQDIMNILRGKPSREMKWRIEAEEWRAKAERKERWVIEHLAEGRVHSAHRDADSPF